LSAAATALSTSSSAGYTLLTKPASLASVAEIKRKFKFSKLIHGNLKIQSIISLRNLPTKSPTYIKF
jgi:hypothetical protein